MLGKNERPSFPLKNIYVYNLWYLAVSKTLNTHDGVILTLGFAENVIFLEKLLFKLYPFLCLLSKECFVLMKINAVQNHWISINLIGHPQGRRLFFAPLAWICFWHALGFLSLLWLVAGCFTFYKLRHHRMFWVTNLLWLNFYKGTQVSL